MWMKLHSKLGIWIFFPVIFTPFGRDIDKAWQFVWFENGLQCLKWFMSLVLANKSRILSILFLSLFAVRTILAIYFYFYRKHFYGMMQVKNGKITAIMSSEIKLEHEEEKCCCDLKEKKCNKVFPATSFGAHQTKWNKHCRCSSIV